MQSLGYAPDSQVIITVLNDGTGDISAGDAVVVASVEYHNKSITKDYGTGSLTKYQVVAKVKAGDTALEGQFIGVANEDIPSGRYGSVVIAGVAVAKVNALSPNVAVGDPLGLMAGGAMMKAATAGDQFVAKALEASLVDGDFIAVIIESGQV